MSRTAKLAALVAVFCVAVLMVPRAHGQEGMPERMSRGEIAKRGKELQGSGLKRSEINELLRISRADRAVFEACVKLYRNKVPMRELGESVRVCKGEPVLLDEYWEFVQKHGCNPREVSKVFRAFPPNKIMRWYYFYYRTGKFGYDKQTDGNASPNKRYGYSEGEVWGIFRAARFNVEHVKEYFEARDKRLSPRQAWAPVREKIKAEIEKEREELRKKAEEAKRKREAEIQARKDAIEAMRNKGQDEDEGKKEEVTTLTGAGLAALLEGGENDEEEGADDEEESPADNDEGESEDQGQEEEEGQQGDEGDEAEDDKE